MNSSQKGARATRRHGRGDDHYSAVPAIPDAKGVGLYPALVQAPSRVAGHAPENVLPAVSSASTRNSLAPLGL